MSSLKIYRYIGITSLYLKDNTERNENQLGILHKIKVFCLNKREKMEEKHNFSLTFHILL